MQKFSTEELTQIAELAALFFTPREIALMMEIEADSFIMDCEFETGSEHFKAFHSGRLQSEVDLRKGIIKLAKIGSSPAQTLALDILLKSKVKMIDK